MGEGGIEKIRLQKFLARCGVASRRASEQLILEGHITVNGAPVTVLGSKINPNADEVRMDGDLLQLPQDAHTFKLNKPKGYLTSMSDPYHRPCIRELIPICEYPSLYPIGRLDMNTSGLLLVTTDGALGHALAHPSKHVNKTYIAKVKGSLEESKLDLLRKGIKVDDDIFAPALCTLISKSPKSSVASITIHEGKNRQVRRMFKAIGHEVIDLKRMSIGPIELNGLKEGECVELTKDEYDALNRLICVDQGLELNANL